MTVSLSWKNTHSTVGLRSSQNSFNCVTGNSSYYSSFPSHKQKLLNKLHWYKTVKAPKNLLIVWLLWLARKLSMAIISCLESYGIAIVLKKTNLRVWYFFIAMLNWKACFIYTLRYSYFTLTSKETHGLIDYFVSPAKYTPGDRKTVGELHFLMHCMKKQSHQQVLQ